jgi:hypothetical protein
MTCLHLVEADVEPRIGRSQFPDLIGCAVSYIDALRGFYWGGWMLGSTAKKLATDETRSAIVTIAAPACAEHFVNKANDEKWAEYQKVDTWRRDTFIKEAGYATMAGLVDDYSTSSAIADACVKALNKLLDTRAK